MSDLDFPLNSDTPLRALGFGSYDATGRPSTFLREVNLELHKVRGQIGQKVCRLDTIYFICYLSVKVTTDCTTCLDFYRFETKVGPDGEDTCAGDSGLTGQTFLTTS